MKKLSIIAILCIAVAICALSCQNDGQITYIRHYTNGQALYVANCQNCHGKNGEGLSALIPPLTDTAYTNRNKHLLACYLQNGVSGIISVNKKFYDNKMPPSGLSPIEIAEVLTYTGNAFGNKQGLVDFKQVSDDLKKCK